MSSECLNSFWASLLATLALCSKTSSKIISPIQKHIIKTDSEGGYRMSNPNSENRRVGGRFQELAQGILSKRCNTEFDVEAAIPIGEPAKNHRFDLASKDRSIVVECKCYTWTDSGNIPSAKLMGLDEAVFYFGFLPAGTKKILCMKKLYSPKGQKRSRSTTSVFMGICSKTSLFTRFRTRER